MTLLELHPDRALPSGSGATQHRQRDLRRDEGSATDLHARARGCGGVRRRRPVRRPGPAADRSRSLCLPDAGLAGHRHRRPRRAEGRRRTGRIGLPNDLADLLRELEALPRHSVALLAGARAGRGLRGRPGAERRDGRLPSTTRSPPGWPSPSSCRAPCSTGSTSRSSRRPTPPRRDCSQHASSPPTGWASGCCRPSGPMPSSTSIDRPGAPTSPSWRPSRASTPRATTASWMRCVSAAAAFVEAGALATDHGHLLADTTPMDADAARALYSRVLSGADPTEAARSPRSPPTCCSRWRRWRARTAW